MRRWMDYIPLLNPVQIAKFLTWQKYSECPAGLFLSQYIDLVSGDISFRKFSINSRRKMDRVPLFQESVDLVTRFALGKARLAWLTWHDELWPVLCMKPRSLLIDLIVLDL